jgi:hypothetical protein|tara:strand:- start:2047 stop:3000 length:954 start_codon:yes stop_codon:yes gene_type:complete
MNEQVNESVDQIEDQPEQTIQDQFFGITNEVVADAPEIELDEVVQETQVVEEQQEQPVASEIEEIKKQLEAEQNAKKAALSSESEAIEQLRKLSEENQRLQGFVSQGSEVLNQQALNNAQWAKHNAQEKLKKAYDEGDSEAMATAQAEMAQATMAEQQAGQYAQAVMNQASENVQPAPEMQKPKLDADMQAWSDKNPWFMNNSNQEHQRMTSFAMYLDQEIRDEGIDPAGNPSLYYSEVDKRMRSQFPNFFGVETQATEVVENSPKQPASVVAPSTRSNGKNPRKVSLSKDQLRVARQLGISPKAYASQYLKLEDNS